MAMSAPLTDPELHEYKQLLKVEKTRYTVGVVWPDGRVTEHICRPPAARGEANGETEGDVVVQWIENRPRIRAAYELQGCIFLADACKADNCPEIYEEWKRVLAARDNGYRIQAKTSDIYPPSVLERRARYAGGEHASGKVYVAGKGLVDSTEAARRSSVADKLESAGIGRPTDADKPSKAKGKKVEEGDTNA